MPTFLYHLYAVCKPRQPHAATARRRTVVDTCQHTLSMHLTLREQETGRPRRAAVVERTLEAHGAPRGALGDARARRVAPAEARVALHPRLERLLLHFSLFGRVILPPL